MALNILLNPQGAKHYKSEFIFKLIDIMKVYFLFILELSPTRLLDPRWICHLIFPSYQNLKHSLAFLLQAFQFLVIYQTSKPLFLFLAPFI